MIHAVALFKTYVLAVFAIYFLLHQRPREPIDKTGVQWSAKNKELISSGCMFAFFVVIGAVFSLDPMQKNANECACSTCHPGDRNRYCFAEHQKRRGIKSAGQVWEKIQCVFLLCLVITHLHEDVKTAKKMFDIKRCVGNQWV